jgi:S1-C subfamily serine protease
MPQITCAECGDSVSTSAQSCPHCGAPADGASDEISRDPSQLMLTSRVDRATNAPTDAATGPTTAKSVRLWHPIVITLVGLPLGFLLSSILVALNWHALRKHVRAVLVWMFAIFYGFCVQQPLLELVAWPWPFVLGLLVWFPPVGLTQLQFLRKNFPRGYPKRSWLLPASLGIAAQLTLLIWTAHDARSATIHPASLSTSVPQQQVYSPEQLSNLRGRTVFEVQTHWRESYLFLFSQEKGMAGSAVLIRADSAGYFFVTNRHVVDRPADSSQYSCALNVGGNVVAVEVSAFARNGLDLALLHVPADGEVENFAMPTLPLNQVAIGQQCVAIGNALGAGASITTGVVSRIDDFGSHRRIRTSAPISPGNSGGGLFSLDGGYLIGITTAEVTAEGAQNINLAIPTDYFTGDDAWDFLDKLTQ